MSCEDQALVATRVCTIFGCDKAPLIKLEKFWICPKCRNSYGENPFAGANVEVQANIRATKKEIVVRYEKIYQEQQNRITSLQMRLNGLLSEKQSWTTKEKLFLERVEQFEYRISSLEHTLESNSRAFRNVEQDSLAWQRVVRETMAELMDLRFVVAHRKMETQPMGSQVEAKVPVPLPMIAKMDKKI